MSDIATLKDTSEKFKQFLKSQKRASATILAYGNDINQMNAFLAGKGISAVSAVSSSLLEEFKADLEKRGYTAKSISRKINSI